MGRKKQEVMTVMPLLQTKQEETQTQFLLRKSSGSSHVDGAEREEGRAHERAGTAGVGRSLTVRHENMAGERPA